MPTRINPADARSRTLFAIGSAGVVALLILGAFLLSSGCGKPPGRVDDDPTNTGPKGDPWEVAAKRLRKETDLAACKAVLAELGNNLAAQESGQKLPALSVEAEAELAKLVPLSPQDREEIRPAAFSSHDPAYLAECLYLRDAARSLDLPGLPPDQLADLGFAWVCRQVYLNPWLVTTDKHTSAVALPPTFVLRRGSGTALERMYVFLALLQQMGLDGCLVGPPEAGEVLAYPAPLGPDKQTPLPGGPNRPFWAVGVRIGSDVRLYDPWRGQPFPAALSQLKANPDAHKAWFEDKANQSGTTPDDVKKATVYLAVPVNALSPRMAVLEEKLKADVGVNLALDPAAMRAEFPDPKPAFWNPPADRFAYGRVLREFLPLEQGGADATPPAASRLYDLYRLGMVPPGVLGTVPALRENEDAANRLRTAAVGVYLTAFYEPPNPREELQRGHFQDAAKELVAKQDEFAKGLERLHRNRDADEDVQQWVTHAKQLYDDLGRTVLIPDKDARAAAVAKAQAAIDGHWKNPVVILLVDKVVSEVGQAEAVFLLALCKQEQAERAQARLERATGTDAATLRRNAADDWATALAEWRTYEGFAEAQKGFPGRAEHAKVLTDRAERLAAQK